MCRLFSSVSKSQWTPKSATSLYQALKILGKWEIRANSQLFKPAIALPAATEGLHWREFSVKAGKARVRLGLNPKFTNFKPPPRSTGKAFEKQTDVGIFSKLSKMLPFFSHQWHHCSHHLHRFHHHESWFMTMILLEMLSLAVFPWTSTEYPLSPSLLKAITANV